MTRAFEILTAAAEPRPSATMSEILAGYIDNLHAPVPGGDALLTNASSEMRMNSREWNLSTSWFIRIGNYRDMVDVSVHITKTGTVLTMPSSMSVRKNLPELRLPGLTLDRADADNTIAAKTILGGCKKLLAQLPPRVTAAAEPEQAPEDQFSKLWLQFMPHERKITASGVTVTLESFDSEPCSIEITMPDGERYSVDETPTLQKIDPGAWDIRVWHVGQRKADFPRIPGKTPAREMLQRILALCVADWKKHKTTTAAVEPPKSVSPAQALAQYFDKHVGTRDLGNGITVTPRRRPGKGLDIDVDNQSYHAHPNYLGNAADVRVEITTPLHVNKGKAVVIVTDVTSVSDLMRQILQPLLDRRPGNHRPPVQAAAEPARISGKWRGYCVIFDDGLTFPTETGCKGTCMVQYEPETGKVYQHGPKGFEHRGKTIADWAGTGHIPVAQTPVPAGGVPGIRLCYDLRFTDGVKLRTATGIRGTSAVYRDLGTGKVYESGPDWHEIKLEGQA